MPAQGTIYHYLYQATAITCHWLLGCPNVQAARIGQLGYSAIEGLQLLMAGSWLMQLSADAAVVHSNSSGDKLAVPTAPLNVDPPPRSSCLSTGQY
jgi:hypothetical protein